MPKTRTLSLFAAVAFISACSLGSSHGSSGGAGAGGSASRGGAGGAGATSAGGGTSGTGSGGAYPGSGGSSGIVTCIPGVAGNAITDCGYPYSSSSPLTSIVFNESEVLRAIEPAGSPPVGIVRVFYNDEHALTLGVRSVIVKTTSGTTTTDYPVSALLTNPGSVTDPQTGTNQLVGNQSGLDVSLRPMWPVLYLTDTTADPNSRAGDWQQGGRPLSPNAVFGTWKAAVRSVDATVTPNAVTITPDADPAKNNWNLGGGDPVPAGLTNQGFGAEARWSVALTPGHSYRLQVLVHDGDQNKAGGDSGEACVIFCSGGAGGEGGTDPDAGTPPPACPTGYPACGPGGIDPASCASGTVCANGCCLPVIP
jgi:hypothetical protein